MKAKVDESLCDGTGICESICPEVFELQGDVAKVIVDEVPKDAEDSAREAEQSCPVDAISIEE
jgi:ferredoxin